IFGHGSFKQIAGLSKRFAPQSPHEVQRAQGPIVSRKALWSSAKRSGEFRATYRRRDAGDDPVDDAVLSVEQFVGGDLHPLAPQARPGLGVVELHRDSNLVIGTAHAAGQHVANAESAAYLAWIGSSPAIDQRRAPRDDEKLAETTERHDNVLDNSVGKIVVRRIVVEILQRQYRDRRQQALNLPRGKHASVGWIECIGPDRPFDVLEIEKAEVARAAANGAPQQLV